jgi:hypothetical protein
LPERLGSAAISVLLLVFALGGILALASNLPEVGAQDLTVATVTVSVPVYQTVFQTVQVSVTANATVTSVTTTESYITIMQSVTEWNTVISITTAMGILGALPSAVLGSYSDSALIVGGALGGAAMVFAYPRLIAIRRNSQDKRRVDVFTVKQPDVSNDVGAVASYPEKISTTSYVSSFPNYDAVMAEHDRIGRLLTPSTKNKADGIAKTLMERRPSNLYAATTAEIRRQFSSSARWGPRGADVVSFYIVSEILDETSKMLHYNQEFSGIGILSELFKKIGDTEKSIINSLDDGEEEAHQADSL